MYVFRDLAWWYWAACCALLIAGLAGWDNAFPLVAAVSAVHLAHFAWRTRSVTSFPVQVRGTYLAIVLLALTPPLHALFWPLTLGTTPRVLFDYCFLARALSLLPWNRRQPFSWRLAWRTFAAPPVRGSILERKATPGNIVRPKI